MRRAILNQPHKTIEEPDEFFEIDSTIPIDVTIYNWLISAHSKATDFKKQAKASLLWTYAAVITTYLFMPCKCTASYFTCYLWSFYPGSNNLILNMRQGPVSYFKHLKSQPFSHPFALQASLTFPSILRVTFAMPQLNMLSMTDLKQVCFHPLIIA